MSIAVPVILVILLAGACITLDVLGWKNFRHSYWLISVLVSFFGNIMFFFMMGYYNSLAVSQREAVTILTETVPYSRYAIICAMFAFFLLGVMLFSILGWVGKYLLNKEEGGKYYKG